ncbi:nucleotidyltransferase family protein [Chryseobacterium sp. SSA4.19]|uniref:nucleotidyltransferase family protein n=1 Tax=Chryseobacterium sp. SSA4.19 TaxID=2919915 RepID=UPI001F4D94DE|nr:nucleotidyltransferase family protein [Chryseobacterium sp. SSA4.19]MCJ8152733.1 nucleotidyltransferase family protein [Chryseobacterium sp. SSA4.19]
MKTGIIILAAGNSSRLGTPKQLLKYSGKSLLYHVAQQALKVTDAVIAVTGFEKISIENEIKNLQLFTAYNPDWQEGMGSSIRIGVKSILHEFPNIGNLIIAVCDQPFIDSSVFSELMTRSRESQKKIIASSYDGVLGTPVLFDRKYFDQLSGLSGNEGAKKLLLRFSQDVGAVDFEKGRIDIDTKDDYEQLIQHHDISTGC